MERVKSGDVELLILLACFAIVLLVVALVAPAT